MKRFNNNDALVSVAYLVSYGIPEGSIYASLFKYQQGKSSAWANFPCPKDKRKRLVQYSSIPKSTVKKYDLPEVKFVLAKIDLDELTERYEAEQKAIFLVDEQIKEVFRNAAEREAVRYHNIYGKLYSDPKVITARALEHAVCLACVEMNAQFTLKEIQRVYKELPYKFVVTDYTRFTMAFKRWKAKDFIVKHGLEGRATNNANAYRLTDFHKAKIEAYRLHPNQYTYEMIHKLLNVDCEMQNEVLISLSSVKKYLNKPENKNRLAYFSNHKYYNREVLPITRRGSIQKPCDLWYGDGTPVQIFCWNRAQTAIIRLNLFIIMDVASGRIMGIDLAESEDKFNHLAALKMALDLNRVAPFEYKYDNASATKTDEFNAVKDKMFLKGTIYTPTKKGNPKEKAQVERFVNTFQSFQRMIDGFIGEGITSKRDNGRINADFLKKCQKKENMYTYESMCKIVAELISIYNAKSIGSKASPNRLFAESEKPRAAKLDATDIALLFWKQKTIKVSRGEVVTTIRHNDYIFDVWQHQTALKLNGTKVKMYYDENDLSSIHLFGLDGGYICECKQKVLVHEGEAGRTEDDTLTLIKQAKHNASIEGIIKTQTNEVIQKGTQDGEMKLLSPFQVYKDELNEAETDLMFAYMANEKGLDPTKAIDYEPIYTGLETPKNANKYSKKHRVENPSLTVIKEAE